MAIKSRYRAHWVQVLYFTIFSIILMAANGYFLPLALMPDSSSYLLISTQIAQNLRDGGTLFDLSEKFRILGYPFLLAVLELVLEPRPFLAIYILQATMVIVSGALLFWTLLQLRVASLGAAALSFLYIAAVPTMLASFLLTDTISNALTAISVCLLVVPLFKPHRPALARVILAGLLMGVAFFFREANQYLIVPISPVVLVIAWQRGKINSGLVLVLAFIAPVLFAGEAYKSFNEVRFGQRFVTTGGRTVMLHAVMGLAKRKPELFDGPSELDQVARATVKDYTFSETLEINQKLFNRGYDELRLANNAFDKYFEAWRRYPLGMALVFLKRLRLDKQARELLNPPLAFYNNERWRGNIDAAESKRMRLALRTGDIHEFLRVIPIVAGRIPSLIIFILFILGSPAAMFLAWRRDERVDALGLAALFICYIGYVSVYGLVNVEMRYLAGIAVILVISAAMTVRVALRWRGWNGSGSSETAQ